MPRPYPDRTIQLTPDPSARRGLVEAKARLVQWLSSSAWDSKGGRILIASKYVVILLAISIVLVRSCS